MRHLWRWLSLALIAALLLLGPNPAAALALEPPPPPEPTLAPPAGGLQAPSAVTGDPTPPGCGTASFSSGALINLAIPDASGAVPGVITTTINTPSIPNYLWRVTVSTDISHTYSGDLQVDLISPAGTRVTLTSRNGGSLDNVFNGTTWTDQAGATNPPGPVTLNAMADNVPETPLSPEEPLSAFRGENPNGTWKLVLIDHAQDDIGTLVRWGLNLFLLTTPPTAFSESQTNTDATAIPDGGTVVPIDFNLYDNSDMVLGDLTLTTYLTHPQTDDLVLELQPTGGEAVTLAKNQGSALDNVFNGTLWSDKAGAANPPGPVTDNTYANEVTESPLAPQEPLGAFAGLNATTPAVWQLLLSDMDTNAQAGNFISATLTATSYTCQPNLNLNVRTPDTARLGVPVPAWVVVTNAAAPTTAPVIVTATLPAGGSFLSAAGPGWTCGGAVVGNSGGTLLCSRPSLAAGAVSTITVLFSSPAVPLEMGTLAAEATTAGEANPGASESDIVRAGAHSANKNPWDVYDQQLSPINDGDGGLDDGGQDAFDDWGMLRLRIFDGGGSLLTATDDLADFGLSYTSGQRWRTTTPVVADTIQVARSLYAPAHTDWLRYVDTFTNTSGAARTVWVAWGGDLGSDSDTVITATSSSDVLLTAADTWAVSVEQDGVLAGDPPVGYAFRSPADTTYQGPGLYDSDPFTDTWPSSGNEYLGHVFRLSLAPGASASLAYFVYRGLSEDEAGPTDCEFYGDCLPQPAAGSQVTLARTTVAALVAGPDFCDLPPAERSQIVNWPGAVMACRLYLPLARR